MTELLRFPTDAEIVAAIRLLARANVLREYETTVSIDRDMDERAASPDAVREYAIKDGLRTIAHKLAGVIVGSDDGWAEDKGFYRRGVCCRLSGWVIAYADARRALTKAETK